MNDMKPKRELTYATVCSGIECMSVACIGLPMRPVFFSEIEPFPCAVLKAHYPNVPNLGDMSQIRVLPSAASSADTTFRKEITNGTTRVILDEPLGILAGGTPCQDVSVAGKRAGMQEGSGTRSSLAFDFVRLARELRPRWVLWENVAGSIDSKNAPDFLRFASALGDCGYSLAWRVLDAQYVRVDGMDRAVPQRRRRVWVVGCLGADESVPAQILFEPDCVAWHTPPRRRAGKGFAYSLAGRDRVDAGVVGEPRSCAVRTANTHANGHGVADEATHTIDGANGQGVVQCYSKVAHASAPNGEGERWDEREVAQTRNTFDNGEKRCQEVVVSTNSNGEDVAATLTRDFAKQTGAQQQNGGGVRPHPPREFFLDRFGQYGDREIASAMKMRDYKDHTDLVVHEKE